MEIASYILKTQKNLFFYVIKNTVIPPADFALWFWFSSAVEDLDSASSPVTFIIQTGRDQKATDHLTASPSSEIKERTLMMVISAWMLFCRLDTVIKVGCRENLTAHTQTSQSACWNIINPYILFLVSLVSCLHVHLALHMHQPHSLYIDWQFGVVLQILWWFIKHKMHITQLFYIDNFQYVM